MELRDIINQMIAQHMKAEQLTDLRFGTVTSASPLEISINTAMAPLQGGILLLTEQVATSGLEVGDKVMLLRVLHGQKYIVLSKVVGG